MEMRWNLDSLYESFESDSFKNDLKKLDNTISEIISWSEKALVSKNDADQKISWWINKENKLGHLYSRLSSYAELIFSVEASNNTAKKYEEILEVKLTALTRSQTMFTKWLASLEDLKAIINGSELLQVHSFYLNELVEKSRFMLADDVEEAIAKMKNTGSTAWSQLWNVLTSNLLVEVESEGEIKKLPLPVVRNIYLP